MWDVARTGVSHIELGASDPAGLAAAHERARAAYHDVAGRPASLERAIRICRRHLSEAAREQDPHRWGVMQTLLGNALKARIGRDRRSALRAAVEAYEAALEVFTHESEPRNWGICHHLLGAALRRFSDAESRERAIDCLAAALEVRSRETDPPAWAGTQHELGIAWAQRIYGDRAENLERALACLDAAAEVRADAGDIEAWARSRHQVGVCLHWRTRGARTDNLEGAIAAFQDAAGVFTPEHSPREWAKIQHNLATVFMRRLVGDRADNRERAIEHFEAALRVRTAEQDPAAWAMTQQNLGILYGARIVGDRADNLERAIACYDAALRVRRRRGAPVEWAMTQHNRATAYHERMRGDRAQNLEEAIAGYRRALQVRTHEERPWEWATTQQDLGAVLALRVRGDRRRNLREAEASCRRALEVFTRDAAPDDWASAHEYLGTVLAAAGRDGEAARAYEAALDVFDAETHLDDRQRVAALLGRLLTSSGFHGRALGPLAEALNLADRLHRTAHTPEGREEQAAECARLARDAISAAFADGQSAGQLLELAEEGRARTLRVRLAGRELPRPAGVSADVLAREAELLSVAASAERELPEAVGRQRRATADRLAAARQELDALWDAMGDRAAGYVSARRAERPSWDEIERWLADQGPAAGVVSLQVLADRSVAVVARSGEQPDAIELNLDAAGAEHLVARFDREVGGSRAGFLRRETWLAEAHEQFAPLASALQGVEPLYIVGGGPLAALPLHAVALDEEPLGVRTSVTYAPSVAVALRASVVPGDRPATSVGKALVIGDPTGDLRHARREAEAVAELLDGRPLLGATATRAASLDAMASSASVHFAAHGVFRADDPLASGVVLAGGEVLAARDLMRLPSVPHLVVVAACDSARHRAVAGEELLGLGHALLLGGARRVVLAGWRIHDAIAADQALAFYDALVSGVGTAEAMRVAYEQTRECSPHTALWGPLRLTGDAR